MELINARKNGNTRQSGLVNVKLTHHPHVPHVVNHVVPSHVVKAHLVKPHSHVTHLVDANHVVISDHNANAIAHEYDYCE